jgi:hypothetical protein
MAVRATKQRMLEHVEPIYCSVDEAEIMCGVSKWTWRAYAYKGVIESCKVGSRLLIPVSEIHRILREGRRPRTDGLAAGEPSTTRKSSTRRDSGVTSAKSGQTVHAQTLARHGSRGQRSERDTAV